MAEPRPPARIKIGPFVYEVRLSENLDGYLGRADHDHGRIELDAGQGFCCLAATLLHEVLHGIWNAAGETDLHDDDAVVDRTANLLLATLLESPDLLEYLAAVRACSRAAGQSAPVSTGAVKRRVRHGMAAVAL